MTLTSANNWSIVFIAFVTSIVTPSGLVTATTLAAGAVYYAYIVTTVDGDGQESAQSVYATLGPITDIRSVAGTNTISWTPLAGEVYYKLYRTQPRYAGTLPSSSSLRYHLL